MSAAERLISSDDHVDLAHPAIKERLATKFHPAYDAALGEFGAAMAKSMSGEANGLWRAQQGLEAGEVADMMSLARRRYPPWMARTDAAAPQGPPVRGGRGRRRRRAEGPG